MAWPCLSCGGSNPDGTRFCGHCGTPAGAVGTDRDNELAAALTTLPESAVTSRLADAGDRAVEERRMVTSLFADISGFTTLSEQLDDPEALHEIIAPVIAKLAEIAERMDGFIAKYAGDALLVFFGAPVAHEDDPARALLVALDMHRQLPSIIAELPKEARGLQMHIGVNTGRVISGRFGGEIRTDYSILGDAVILAQRLESVAGAGETYVGETTYELTKNQFVFEYVGELTLKGKSKPVPGYRLVSTRELPSISGTRTDRPGIPLIGREAELESVERVLGPLVRERTGGIVTVVGEPGVGKSRLLREVHERAAARGVRWYQARCLTYGATLPYWPAIDLLRQVIGFRVEDRQDVILERLQEGLADVPHALPFIARLLGLPAGHAVGELEPEAFRRGLHRAFCDWVVRLTDDGPIVLAVEDVHWADSASQVLGAELARLGATHPVLVYFTARPEGQGVVDTLAAAVGDLRRVQIELARFDPSHTQAFLRALLDADPPARLVEVVAGRTQGNPLFVEEVVRSLREDASLVFDGGRWRLSSSWDADAVPDTIERVLAARIDMLPAPTAGVLQTASVLGRVIRLSLMEAVAEDIEGLNAELDALIDSGFLDPTVDAGERAVMFHHALVQEVAYNRLLKRHRRDLHRRVVQVAEQLYGRGDEIIDLLARHAYLGEMGAVAIDYLATAGERSKRIFANDQAIQHFRRAVEVAESEQHTKARVSAMLLQIAGLEDVVGEYDEALALFDRVREQTGAVDAWRGCAAIRRKRGECGAALEVVDEGFASKGRTTPDVASLWLEKGWTCAILGRYVEAREALAAGLDAVGEVDSQIAAELLSQLARAESHLGHQEDALRHGLAAESMFERLGALAGMVTATRVVAWIYHQLGRLDDAAGSCRRALALAERTGRLEEKAAVLINLGMVELARGSLDDAIACDLQAIDECERMGHRVGRLNGYCNLAEKLMLSGDLAGAEEYCRRALPEASEIGQQEAIADATLTLASIRLQQARIHEAVTMFEEAVDRLEQLGDLDKAVASLQKAADALVALGARERARELSSRALQLSGRMPTAQVQP